MRSLSTCGNHARVNSKTRSTLEALGIRDFCTKLHVCKTANEPELQLKQTIIFCVVFEVQKQDFEVYGNPLDG